MKFDTIKDLDLKERSDSTVTIRTDKKIKRKSGVGASVSIVTANEDKIHRITIFKRHRRDDNTSVPFGNK